MDPLSIVGTVGALCVTSVKLITAISDFVDSVREAPKEVQALNSQLASMYACLGHLKVAIQGPRVSEIPESWITTFEKLAEDCNDTLDRVKAVVDKAKITETASSATQMLKTVKFTFQSDKVRKLRDRLNSQTSILSNLLAALNESRGQHLEKRVESIHDMVEELVESRRNIKETIAIIAEDNNDEAEIVIQDRRRKTASPETATSDPEPSAEEGGNINSSDTSDWTFAQFVAALNATDTAKRLLIGTHAEELAAAKLEAEKHLVTEINRVENLLTKTHQAEIERLHREIGSSRGLAEEFATLQAELHALASSNMEMTRQLSEFLRPQQSSPPQPEEINRSLLSEAQLSDVIAADRLTWRVSKLELRPSRDDRRSNDLKDLTFSNIGIKLRVDRVLWIEEAPRSFGFMSVWFTQSYQISRQYKGIFIQGPYRAGLSAYGKSQYDCFIEFKDESDAVEFMRVFSNILAACDQAWKAHAEIFDKLATNVDISSEEALRATVDEESAVYVWAQGALGKHGFGDMIVSEFGLWKSFLQRM